MSSLIERAKAFATKAHEGQARKYTMEPYINHPCEVAQIVRGVEGCNDFMIAAAWLHDVVEDTPVTLSGIWNEFGLQVALLVEQLTDISRPEDGNRKVRKEMDRLHLFNASPEAKTIKIADIISNTPSIVENDKNFAKVFIKESRLLLDFLREGDNDLWHKAYRLTKLKI